MVLTREILACLPRPSSKYPGPYPLGFEKRIPKIIQTNSDNFLHLFAGMSKTGHRVDSNPEVNPDTLSDCHKLPFNDNTFEGAMCDPPYTTLFARKLYKTDLPKFKTWSKEVVRVVKPWRIIAIMHNFEMHQLANCERDNVYYFPNRPGQYPRIVTTFIKTGNNEDETR